MTKEQLAAILNGNEYGEEITKEQEQQAKADRLVVAFGHSDDTMIFRGALDNEFSCFGGGEIYFTKYGREVIYERYNLLSNTNIIEVIFDKEYGVSDEYCPMQFKTEIPHAAFRIMESGSLYCVGIVFNVHDLI
jgi:hypothetical protein